MTKWLNGPITRSVREPMTTLIRNGTVVTAQETRKADVLIEGERISQVGRGPRRRLRLPG